jgi:hypothetical protein
METKVTNQVIKNRIKSYISQLDDTVKEYDLLKNADIKAAHTNIKAELKILAAKL